jgi:hypothetical protein
VILLLAAYNKSEDLSAKRQQTEIELARRRLKDWQWSPSSTICRRFRGAGDVVTGSMPGL